MNINTARNAVEAATIAPANTPETTLITLVTTPIATVRADVKTVEATTNAPSGRNNKQPIVLSSLPHFVGEN
jgi:hypothetical protein